MAIPVFHLFKASSAFKTFMGRSCAITKLCMFGIGLCISPYRVTNGNSWFKAERELEPGVLAYQHRNMDHVMHFLEYIIIAKIQTHYPIICRDIPHFVFWHHIGAICVVNSNLICIIKNRECLRNERRYCKKRKLRRLSFLKAFYRSISCFYFICT